MSNQVGDCFKFLWPFQNVRTLKNFAGLFDDVETTDDNTEDPFKSEVSGFCTTIEEMVGYNETQQKFLCLACREFQSYRKDTIKRHLKMVHTERQHAKCPHCSKFYKNDITLKTHIRRNHQK